MKHIIKVENFDNLPIVRPLIAMVRGASGEPEFSIKEPRTIITGTWDPSLTDNTKEVLIRGEVILNGKTDCYSLMFEEGGHLTINGGARLRVWQGGITNNDCTTVNYLTIVEDSVNDSYGEFLLHPDVTVNNHPLASIILSSLSYVNGSSDYQSQRFGVPSWNALNEISTESSIRTRFNVYEGTSWKLLGYLNPSGSEAIVNKANFNRPFATYILLAYRNSNVEHPSYKFTGQLVGNIDTALNVTNYWTAFTNSYSAKINTLKFLTALENSGISLYESLMYGITVGGSKGYEWVTLNHENVSQYPYINPMWPIIIEKTSGSTSTFSFTLSYKDLVWDPSFEEDITPTRGLMKGALTTAKPSEVDTTLEGSGIFDNPMSQFPPEHDER